MNYKEQENVLLSINNLKDAVTELRADLPAILHPITLIQEHLNNLFKIECDYSLELDIDEQEIIIRAITGLVEESDKWEFLTDSFNTLIDELESWKDSLDEDDDYTIDLVCTYLEDVGSIIDRLDTTCIDFYSYEDYIDGVDDMLLDIFNALDEFII